MSTKKELITPDKREKVRKRLEELLVRCWRQSRPIFPKMLLDFRVFPQEVYYSTVGKIFWVTPFWRGDEFTTTILYHEGHHWNIYPVDVFRSLKEIFDARRLLAEEEGYKPKIIKKGLYREEEDWSSFKYSVQEIQFVQNILGDYLINIHIHDTYPLVWKALWSFLKKEGTFYKEGKAMKRDTTFDLYLAVYPELLPDLEEIPLHNPWSIERVPLIAKVIREVRAGNISTTYALKELVKLFHYHIQSDYQHMMQEGKGKGKGKKGKADFKCPKCGHEDWEIVAYTDEKGNWVKVK